MGQALAQPTQPAGRADASDKASLSGRIKDLWPEKKLTALQSAIIDNDADEVRRLLDTSHVDVDEADNDGHTALHIAALLNSEKFVELLLEYDADAEACDGRGLTPAYIAAQFKASGQVTQSLQPTQELTGAPAIKHPGRTGTA